MAVLGAWNNIYDINGCLSIRHSISPGDAILTLAPAPRKNPRGPSCRSIALAVPAIPGLSQAPGVASTPAAASLRAVCMRSFTRSRGVVTQEAAHPAVADLQEYGNIHAHIHITHKYNITITTDTKSI